MVRNTLILLVSCLVSLVLAEAVVRLVLDPVDHLAVETVPDDMLNHRIAPGASGHDDWGFRNKDVPDRADVIAIGDSMTYGIMATSTQSWPAQLAETTGKTVYNAGLGGYGPLHYLHILRTRAPELSPGTVVVMLYLGNDLLDAYNLAYSNDNWSAYRDPDNSEEVDPALFLPREGPKKRFHGLRTWLAENSVLYRLATQNALLDGFRSQQAQRLSGTAFLVEHQGQSVLLDPAKRLSFADLDDPRLVEALEITKRALSEMAAFCADNGMQMHVTLMPVREHIYLDTVREGLDDTQTAQMEALASNLDKSRAALTAHLAEIGVAHSDLQQPLQTAMQTEIIYPPADGHPNGTGYGVTARALSGELNL